MTYSIYQVHEQTGSILPADVAELFDSLPCLDDRERGILKALCAGEGLRPVGRRVGVSYERVRQLAEAAIVRIANAMRPGWPVLPGAVERFRSMLRAEAAEVMTDRAQHVRYAELHAV